MKEPLNIKFSEVHNSKNFEVVRGNTTGLFDHSNLNFPLSIRKWTPGDFFYPYGMKGVKKLSDYFTDEKLSPVDKENIWLLCNNNDIIWIIGHRTDNRYRVTSKTKKVYIAELISK